MRNFKELIIWQKSYSLTLDIYKITAAFPKEETFGLISQMRRSAYSIPTNIAEGCGHGSSKQLNRFLDIASGSAAELDCQIMLSKDLNYIDEQTFHLLENKITEVRKTIYSFKRTIVN